MSASVITETLSDEAPVAHILPLAPPLPWAWHPVPILNGSGGWSGHSGWGSSGSGSDEAPSLSSLQASQEEIWRRQDKAVQAEMQRSCDEADALADSVERRIREQQQQQQQQRAKGQRDQKFDKAMQQWQQQVKLDGRWLPPPLRHFPPLPPSRPQQSLLELLQSAEPFAAEEEKEGEEEIKTAEGATSTSVPMVDVAPAADTSSSSGGEPHDEVKTTEKATEEEEPSLKRAKIAPMGSSALHEGHRQQQQRQPPPPPPLQEQKEEELNQNLFNGDTEMMVIPAPEDQAHSSSNDVYESRFFPSPLSPLRPWNELEWNFVESRLPGAHMTRLWRVYNARWMDKFNRQRCLYRARSDLAGSSLPSSLPSDELLQPHEVTHPPTACDALWVLLPASVGSDDDPNKLPHVLQRAFTPVNNVNGYVKPVIRGSQYWQRVVRDLMSPSAVSNGADKRAVCLWLCLMLPGQNVSFNHPDAFHDVHENPSSFHSIITTERAPSDEWYTEVAVYSGLCCMPVYIVEIERLEALELIESGKSGEADDMVEMAG